MQIFAIVSFIVSDSKKYMYYVTIFSVIANKNNLIAINELFNA